jgi:hypothetical protein
MVGVVAFFALAVMTAVACHRWIRPFALAWLISGPLAAAVFQVGVTVQLGHVDPFIFIALGTTTFAAWGVSLVVGLVLKVLSFEAPPTEPDRVSIEPVSGVPTSTPPGDGDTR